LRRQAHHVGDYPEGIGGDIGRRRSIVANWESNTRSHHRRRRAEGDREVKVGDGPRRSGRSCWR